MKKLILIILLMWTNSLLSQNCNCVDALTDIIEFTEENYSLISFKINSENKHIYEAQKKTILNKAKTDKELNCNELIDTYLNFFNDGHLFVFDDIFSASAEQSSLKQKTYQETTKLDSLKIMKLLQSDNLDPIEGIWESGTYTIGIVKNQNKKRERDFAGIVLQSNNPNFKAGEIKMEIRHQKDDYQADYLMGDKSVKQVSTKIIDQYNINQEDLFFWKKLYPLPDGATGKEIGELDPRGVVFKDLGNKNYYIKIGSFNSGNIPIVEKLISKYEEELQNANLLIVDLRDNEGGSDYTYAPLLPYIYSGPVQMAKFGAWVSPGSKEYFSEWLEKSDTVNNTLLYQAMQSDTPQLVTWSEDDMIDELDTLYTQPHKIAIIANEESASSAETFIFRCNQSNKVVTFGQNTNGTVDGFNGTDYVTDCFKLRYPTCLRTVYYDKEAIDPFGILPDVYLSKDMDDPINYIVEFMNNYRVPK